MCDGIDRPASKCETAESPGDESSADKESLEESEDDQDEQEEDSSSSYTTSYTESYTSEDLIPIENDDEDILENVPENILNDTSFGDIDRAKDLVDEDLQCLLCNNFDHLIPRLDIAIKLEPVVGEPISKSSVLLCTQCDLMVCVLVLDHFILGYWFQLSIFIFDIARALLVIGKGSAIFTNSDSKYVPEQ